MSATLPTLDHLQQEIDRLKHEINRFASLDRKLQILLGLQYGSAGRLPLRNVEFRSFSQNGEDGILLYIFSVIGSTNRKAVEICAGDGMECNIANLIINHGWTGLLFDADEAKIARGRQLYGGLSDTFIRPPQLVHTWITTDNVNNLVRGHGFEGEIDLLSLDIDGNDYWIWKALDCIQPRVIVLEYNAWWGPHRSVTVPYDPAFQVDLSRQPLYCGASLAAFVKLAREKGYRLVGSDRMEINAFFVRSDLGCDLLPEVPAASCLHHWIDHDWGHQVWVEV
jgi:hypothetical protein